MTVPSDKRGNFRRALEAALRELLAVFRCFFTDVLLFFRFIVLVWKLWWHTVGRAGREARVLRQLKLSIQKLPDLKLIP
jgi:hypothetical protein